MTIARKPSLPKTLSRRGNWNMIHSTIMDDNEKVFPIEITYNYHVKGLFELTTVISNVDYKLCPDAVICKGNLDDQIWDIIREEEGTPIEFF